MRTRVVLSEFVKKEWNQLDQKVRDEFAFVFEILNTKGNWPSSKFKLLAGTRFWEFRVKVDGLAYRAIGTFCSRDFLVLILFHKQTQKTLLN